MPSPDLIAALRSGKLAAVRGALKANPRAARSPRPVVVAGGLAWKEALALLKDHGADLNATWRGYRPLHNLIQEHPHAGPRAPSAARLACLDWLLKNGADPEMLGAWPPARAFLIAAFAGEKAYVNRLRKAGARIDGFAGAALGDVRLVEKALKQDSGFSRARDRGGLTALQCCAGSRLAAPSRLLRIAGLLLDHGADANARTKSWSHEVDVCYFAVNAANHEMFELLLRRGADATAALPSAVWQKTMDFAELALRYGAQLDGARDGDKPLLNEMIRWGRVDSALWLLERGASPNIADARGWTAVHQAASRGNERMMKAVLAAGGDCRRRDAGGDTPQDVAVMMEKPKMAALLGS
jgi:ankyrin repeat protein